MKKILLFVILFILTCSLTSIGQNIDKRLSFLKEYFSAESLLKLSMRHNAEEDNFSLFIIEANKAASRAQTLLDEIEPIIKSKLTKEELDDLKASVKFIDERSEQIESFDQPSLMKLTIWFQLAEKKLSPIFSKLMK